ncbi:DUF3846 domain-containing protein [Slackia exigua]|uniref:DUF3846 domain-containing protein n=1 Tax=Slackia exigua TaxID=84109 RepID=UPI0028CFFF58|nr:DUF3846 domain-containing protein [Slackia exigua]
MRVAVMEFDEEIKTKDIKPDEDGSYLHALQAIVGGNIEALDVLYDEQPLLWVNEEGIFEKLMPSRAIYANKRMEEAGYLSQMDGETAVKDGELYTIVFGPCVACSYDRNDDGEDVMRDITDEELLKLEEDFWNKRSGLEELLRIKFHMPHGTR